MAWVSLDTVFAENSRRYADDEYNREWKPYQAIIDSYTKALEGRTKYSREPKTNDKVFEM